MPMFLALIVGAVGGAVSSLVCQYLLVPLVVRVIGEDKFAEMGGIDAISHAIAAGFIGFIAYPCAVQRFGYLPATLVFPVLGLLCVAYDIFLLTLIGRSKSRTEFILDNGAIIRKKDGVELHPTFLRQETEYTQTDAFLGYSFYELGLYDGSGLLASNVYLSEPTMEAALNEILNRKDKTICRYLDLSLVYRKSEFVWWTYPFAQEHADIFCSPLAEVSEECRDWWRQWLRPTFAVDGCVTISTEELKKYYQELKAGYPERFPTEAENLGSHAQYTRWPTEEEAKDKVAQTKRHQDLQRTQWTIFETILEDAPGPFEFMTEDGAEKERRKIAPNGGTLMYGGGDEKLHFFEVRLEPR